MVAARYLSGWGAEARVILAAEPHPEQHSVAARQLAVLRAMGLQVDVGVDLPATDLIIDGLLGFSTRSAPTGAVAELIRAINAAGSPVLATDLPSGLHASTGEPFDPTVQATATLTLALPKTGLHEQAAKPYVGDLWLADIGIPLAAYSAAGIDVGAIFALDEFIQL
jgi:NAD(P)H-hydrate epimerase